MGRGSNGRAAVPDGALSIELIVAGNEGGSNVGASLRRGARVLGIDAKLIDSTQAYAAPRIVARVNWWLRGRRPTRLAQYSRSVVEACRTLRPKWLIATGLAPLTRGAVADIRRMGVATINYLTDDPWNPAFRCTWFLDALHEYEWVFSVRTANCDDLRRHGCSNVSFLRFGFDPDLFFPDSSSPDEAARYRSDVLFAGGADRDRVSYITALLGARLDVGLYGDYWERYRETAHVARGHASTDVVRKAIAVSAVSLCLVRRANRDGHSMRSFEVPAARGCVLAEDTDDHRELFGPEGHAALYFSNPEHAATQAALLVADPALRRRLALRSHEIVTGGGHTYADRLKTALAIVSGTHAQDRDRRSGTLSRV